MSLGQIIMAIQNSKVDHFDLIDFDACFMGSVEVVLALAEYTDYLVASPEKIPGYGHEYTTWLNALAGNTDMDGFELGRIIVDAAIGFYEDEDSDGYGDPATLSVIDTKNFRERMLPLLMQLAQTLNKEITIVGKENLLLNFTDEFRILPMVFEYCDEALLDLGSLADHLGINMSELDNYQYVYEMDNMPNAYTEITQEIEAILADRDGSGDDVIYGRITENMTKPVFAEYRYTRNEDGELEPEDSISSTGLSILFNPLDRSATMKYLDVLEMVCDRLSDEEIVAMLREYELASARYLLAAASGRTISTLLDSGETNVYYKTVRDYWQTERELDEDEIVVYMEQMGLTTNISGIKASDWNAYIADLMELLDKYSDTDTETWLALLTAQQSSEAVRADTTVAEGIDKDGDGRLDAYRVTVQSPLSLIKDVSMNISGAGIKSADNWKMLFGENVNLGKLPGDLAKDKLLSDLDNPEDMNEGALAAYHSERISYDLDASVDRWYELTDSEGTGHIISVGEVDPDHDTELRIPVGIQLQEYNEYGDSKTLYGWLVYSDGHFLGFSDQHTPTPYIPLSEEKFDGAIVVPCQVHSFNFVYDTIYVFGSISDYFELPMERTDDRGMKVVLTPISEIADLNGGTVMNQAVVTDIYGYEHDISSALKEADEKAASGELLKSIKGAKITTGELVYNEKYQKQKINVTYNAEQLEENVDFNVVMETQAEPGEYNVIVYGIGDYCGYVVADFTIADGEMTEEEISEE